MISIKMITFCKSVNCPTSQEILAFQTGRSSPAEGEAIEAHLSLCEFCAAEVEFYSNYPQADEKIPTVEIPIHLFELAQSLMGNPKQDGLEFLCGKKKITT